MIAKILIRASQTQKNHLQDTAKPQGHTLNAFILQVLWDWAAQHKQDHAS